MSRMYFNPGCALSIYKPYMEQKVLAFLREHYADIEMHKVCCRHDPCIDKGSVIINICGGCNRRFGSLYEGISTISFWETLDQMKFPYPDYSGIKMSVHDACPVREKPQIHLAIRSLLRKMNIEIIEVKDHGTNSICCGDSYYPSLPLDQVHENMTNRAHSMPCDDVVVYCVSCIKSMFIGGKNPRYMIDLLFNEATTPEIYDTIEWHNQLKTYIDAH